MTQITVYDYIDARHGGSTSQDNTKALQEPPVVYEVDAVCVGGEDGIRAYWVTDNFMYEAYGDDGHWWLVSVTHVDWLHEITACLTVLPTYMESS